MKQKIKRPILFAVFLMLTLLWIVFIFRRSAQGAATSGEESGRLLCWLQQFLPWMTDFLIRKAAHLTEFFLLGALVSCTVRAAGKTLPWVAVLVGMAVAVSDELIQLTQQGRSCEVRDMCVDTAGALLAAVLFWLIFRYCDKKKIAKNERVPS